MLGKSSRAWQVDKALLIGSQPVAANENHAILAFESAFNAEQTMKRDNLNTMFGNILSNAAGFSPEILAVSMEEWTQIRAEFSAKARGQKRKWWKRGGKRHPWGEFHFLSIKSPCKTINTWIFYWIMVKNNFMNRKQFAG